MDFLVKRNYLENVSGFESCGKYAWRNFIYITSKEPKKRTKRLKKIYEQNFDKYQRLVLTKQFAHSSNLSQVSSQKLR